LKYLHGLLLSISIAIVALIISQFLPLGSVAIAIILGAIIGNTITLNKKYESGIGYAEKTLLAYAITLLGINLDFNIIVDLGYNSILLIVFGMIFTIYSAIFIAKKMGFDKDFALILGIGNGVCGSAAIAATKDIVKLNKEKTALAVAIVNFLGTVAIFILPLVGTYILHFSDIQIGVLIGNTLQAVGHVVASGFSVSDNAGQSATIVKMGRVLMLTPLVFILIYIVSQRSKKIDGNTNKASVPFFIWGFLFFAIVATLDLLPPFAVESISTASKYLLLIAMSAIGLKINFSTIKTHGGDALKLSLYVFILQIVFSSLFLILFF